jgi:sulfatase maturation enzyme AslB (radical SAM superfamily)
MTCIDAFKNINIVSNGDSLRISPCCYSPTVAVQSIEFKDDAYLTSIRNDWSNGEYPSACSKCEKQDSSGVPSRRVGSNQWYADNGHHDTVVDLIRMDYWTGDICNLRCAICGPHNSSGWKQELNLPIKKANVNRFWKNMDISKLKFIHFNGGEPLLSKEHIVLLKEIPEKHLVHLNYNTNGTVTPSDELLALWGEFKIVQLDFSIDDIGDRFEYQRYPAKWDLVQLNLQWFIDNCPVNCMFAVNTTVSILNYANLNNLSTWLKENFKSNRVDDVITYRQQPAHGLFSLGDNRLTPQMIKFLDDCDARRGTNWRNVFPELT